MKFSISIITIFLLLISLYSCSTSFQYDVYVINKTPYEIKVSFKSMKHKTGPIEKDIFLPPGERRLIISTQEITSSIKTRGTSAAHCYQVAEYVTAHLDNQLSKIEWCKEGIDFIQSDIGQGEFIIVYKEEDF